MHAVKYHNAHRTRMRSGSFVWVACDIPRRTPASWVYETVRNTPHCYACGRRCSDTVAVCYPMLSNASRRCFMMAARDVGDGCMLELIPHRWSNCTHTSYSFCARSITPSISGPAIDMSDLECRSTRYRLARKCSTESVRRWDGGRQKSKEQGTWIKETSIRWSLPPNVSAVAKLRLATIYAASELLCWKYLYIVRGRWRQALASHGEKRETT